MRCCYGRSQSEKATSHLDRCCGPKQLSVEHTCSLYNMRMCTFSKTWLNSKVCCFKVLQKLSSPYVGITTETVDSLNHRAKWQRTKSGWSSEPQKRRRFNPLRLLKHFPSLDCFAADVVHPPSCLSMPTDFLHWFCVLQVSFSLKYEVQYRCDSKLSRSISFAQPAWSYFDVWNEKNSRPGKYWKPMCMSKLYSTIIPTLPVSAWLQHHTLDMM